METTRIEEVLEDIKQHYKSWSEFMEQEVDFCKVGLSQILCKVQTAIKQEQF